jgi:hypothetical protein
MTSASQPRRAMAAHKADTMIVIEKALFFIEETPVSVGER